MIRRLRQNQHAILAVLFALVAGVLAAREAGYLGGGPEAAAPAPRLAALTADRKDMTLLREDGAVREIARTNPNGTVSDAAPLMDWEDRNVRTGATQVWCLRDADPEARDVLRDILTTLAQRFAPQGRSGIVWRESCQNATYSLGKDAQTQCGIGDGALACAGPTHYCGRTVKGDAWCGGHLSYNGNYRQYTLSGGRQGLSPGLDGGGLRAALSHEVQHLLLNLGHNDCGVVRDPLTRLPVPSIMTGVVLPSGPSCSVPPAAGLADADWTFALTYYDFGPAAAPTPTPPAGPTLPPGLPLAAHPERQVSESTGRVAPTFTSYDLRVVGLIADEGDRTGLPPLWLLAMGAQEGGLACGPFAGAVCPTGDLDLDAAGSCGTFQIYIKAHGGSCAYWQNPINAMREMDARWKWAFAQAGGGDAFLRDPHSFLIGSVPLAQGSIGWDKSIASGAFRVALISYIDLLQSRGAVVPADLAGSLTVAAGGLDDIALRAAVQAEQLRKAAGR